MPFAFESFIDSDSPKEGPGLKAAELMVSALEQEGVEVVFGIPGEENLDFLDALSRSRIELVLTRHEQAAGFMAATHGRLTGKPGVCMSTLGPGATNLLTSAAYAQLGGMPMVMITGQKPITEGKQGQFQILDVVNLMEPVTKFSHGISSAGTIPARVREAFRIASEERPGAVHLELPEDIAREEVEAPLLPTPVTRRPIAEGKAVAAAVARLEAARHPVVVVASGANRTLTHRMLRGFIDTFGIPFATTQMGKGVVDEHHPLHLGNAALSSGDFVHRAIEAADLILNIGHDIVEKPPFLMKPDGPDVIHVNFSPASVDPVYFPQVEVVGDIANSIWQISEALTKPDSWDFQRQLEVRAAGERQLLEGAGDARFPILPQRLVADVRQALDADGILTLDNGIYKIWFARNYKARQPNTVLLDNALATMGAGLPQAIAAKRVYPGRQVMAVCGDGGFMMNSQELETAVRLGLDIVVVILRDDAYGMIRWKQAHMGLAAYGLDYGNPDFVDYARSYGAKGHRPETAADLLPLLRGALSEPGVHLVEVPVDYSQNDRILNHDIQQRSAAI